MRRLIALDLPGGPAFVDAVRRAWDDGDAILPIDSRLPAAARTSLLATARPHSVVDASGTHALDDAAPLLDDGDSVVVASSGTTGEPKLVVHTFDGVSAHAHAVHDHLHVGTADRWLACLPLAHIGGLGVVLRSIVTDTPVDVTDRFDPIAVAEAPRRLGTTMVSLVTTALDRIDPATFRWIVLGGSADPTERPDNVVHTYGTTETGGGIVYGREPLRGIEIRIADTGVIAVRGPTLARGLRTASGEVHPVVDADGWFQTGDLGHWVLDQSPNGRHLVVDGRADDLIVTGGQNVWPEAVEAVVKTMPGITDAAVFGRPDPEWGQRVHVAIVVGDGTPTPSVDEIREHVRRHLPSYAAPKDVLVVSELPRTALGKIRRRELSERC